MYLGIVSFCLIIVISPWVSTEKEPNIVRHNSTAGFLYLDWLYKKALNLAMNPERDDYHPEVLVPGLMKGNFSSGGCYVCGLKETGVPLNNTCEHWFDDTADFTDKFKKEEFMSYCFREPEDYCKLIRNKSLTRFRRNLDIPLYQLPRYGTQPNFECGNFTGGCFKRWVDLNGIYTERGCRNRQRPVRGKSVVSKRLQKLEKTLEGVKDGCVTSPLAILTPFSRAVSLFARYHACVCSTDWCNSATSWDNQSQFVLLITCILSFYSVYF